MQPYKPFEWFCFSMGVLLSPLVLPPIWAVRYAKERSRRKVTDPPKPAQRPRSLSDAGGEDLQQLQSRLFQLPAELRNQIYEELLGADHAVHIIGNNGTLHSMVCREPKYNAGDDEYQHDWHDCIRHGSLHLGMGGHGTGVLGFVSSCRQAYTETIRLVYSRPTFIFHNYYTQLLFSASVISQSFHSIRSIRIMPANEPYHGHSSRANAWEASYRFLRHRGIVVRNPDVPKIPAQPRWYDLSDSKEKQSQQEPVDPFNVWQHIFLIMRAMQGLRKFRLDAKDDQHLLQTHLAGPAAGTFWLQMKNFAQSRVFDKGFDIVFWPSTGPVQVCVGEELEDLGVVRRRNEKVTAD